MIKRFTPTYHAQSIFEVIPDFYIVNNVKVLLLDLDNTLDSYKTALPSKRTIDYINSLKENNIRMIITSNNFGRRVSAYSNALGVEFMSFVKKPLAKKLLLKLKELNINKDVCLLIGDQLMTDIQCGNNAKIRTMLTEKIVKEDQLTTRINRIFDKPIRARLLKCGKLNNWKKYL